MFSWYSFKPVDTLFFRGAEPMNMGEDHTVSFLFPPPANTISGAVRTAYLVQKGVSFNDYAGKNIPEAITDEIGFAGENPPFEIIGPLFMFKNELYIPTPYNWYGQKYKNKEEYYKTRVYKSFIPETNLIKTKNKLFWVMGGNDDIENLGGKWINFKSLYSNTVEKEIYKPEYFYTYETRTGIAINNSRSVRKGHLYTFKHARLKEDVYLVFGINKNISIDEKGTLKLGAEQRFGKYEKIELDNLNFNGGGKYYLSLSIQECNKESNENIIATGKIKYIGGWDLNKQFHKPMVGYFSSGSVFNKRISENLITF